MFKFIERLAAGFLFAWFLPQLHLFLADRAEFTFLKRSDSLGNRHARSLTRLDNTAAIFTTATGQVTDVIYWLGLVV